jgi:uncharacterized membrane protein
LILACTLPFAALVRIIYLGDRSLWLDEFSTWHVSRMPLVQSLVWPAELSPPLYALCVRALGGGTHPPEWLLRLPAALAGVLTIAAVWRLMRLCGSGGGIATTAVLLLAATHVLLIDYSREARPYAFLVLFVTLAMCAALRVARERTLPAAWEWAAWATLALYSHTIAAFSLAACGAFWIWSWKQRPDRALVRSAGVALLATTVLVSPLAVRSWHFRAEIAEGLKWIEAAPAGSIVPAITAIAPGGSARPEDFRSGLIGLAITTAAVVIGLVARRQNAESERSPTVNSDSLVLLGCWLACALGSPLILSIAGRPLLIPRFILPAAIPLLALPLILLARVSPRLVAGAALVLLTLQALGARRVMDLPPAGLRELVGFLNLSVQPDRDAVVLCVHATREEFVVYERLGLRYYQPAFGPPAELHLNDANSASVAALHDPRRLYLIVFQGDPAESLRKAGREIEPFVDLPELPKSLDALLFEPYRLLKIAPLPQPAGV